MNAATSVFYNGFSFFYPLVNFVLKPQRQRLIKEVNNQLPGQLLEIGVGTGTHLREYKKHLITAIDSSPGMLRKAARYASKDIRVLVMDGEHLVFPESCFDYVVLSHVIAVVDDPEQLINEIFRVMKPGGKLFILNHFTPDNWLKYFDRFFELPARYLRFKSVFHIAGIAALNNFISAGQICFGSHAYFKLLIYRKP